MLTKLIKLKPSYKEYLWGGTRLKDEYNKSFNGEILAETWELSCHQDGHSYIYGTKETFKDFVEENSEILGTNCQKFDRFPILTKFIDAKDNLSIQVHPNDEYALKNENQYGKTEMWYVTDCKEGAYLYYGFKEKISKEEFKKRIENDTLLEVLNKVYVKKGDVFFIEAGTIHAIGKDITIAEIQQNSNLTYRVYDYGRVDKDGNKRDLHIEKALEVTNLEPSTMTKTNNDHIGQCKYFTVDKIEVNKNTDIHVDKVDEKSFVHFLVTDGHGEISTNEHCMKLEKGDSVFLPANSGYYKITGNCEALKTCI